MPSKCTTQTCISQYTRPHLINCRWDDGGTTISYTKSSHMAGIIHTVGINSSISKVAPLLAAI